MLFFFINLKSYGIFGQIYDLILFFSVIDDFEWFWTGSLHEISQDFILDPVLFLLYINDLSDDAICNIAIYAVDTTLYSKCD